MLYFLYKLILLQPLLVKMFHVMATTAAFPQNNFCSPVAY